MCRLLKRLLLHLHIRLLPYLTATTQRMDLSLLTRRQLRRLFRRRQRHNVRLKGIIRLSGCSTRWTEPCLFYLIGGSRRWYCLSRWIIALKLWKIDMLIGYLLLQLNLLQLWRLGTSRRTRHRVTRRIRCSTRSIRRLSTHCMGYRTRSSRKSHSFNWLWLFDLRRLHCRCTSRCRRRRCTYNRCGLLGLALR